MSDLLCWNCDEMMDYEEQSDADGNCPHCFSEMHLPDVIEGYKVALYMIEKGDVEGGLRHAKDKLGYKTV